ncbi:MAG: hypothetical protein LW860_05445 [Xanthomonadaceae bacterium]|jgi:hypothetical protein|nr:hypothetical protein [Xanthomonadaceae bacterium]
MSYSYCEAWFRARKVATKPLTEAQARHRHDTKGALYTVLLGDPQRPSAFIEIVSDDSIQVEFLDEHLRTRGYYQFVRQEDCRLFMVSAAFSEFSGDSKRPRLSRRFSFKPDGRVMCFETDFDDAADEEVVIEKRMDVSLNWEPYPAFGDYASIARFDRDKLCSRDTV